MQTTYKLRGGLLAAASALGMAWALPAAAQTDQARLQALEAQIQALQSEVESLKTAQPAVGAASVTLSPSPRFTGPGGFTFRPRGRLEFDAAAFDAAGFSGGTQLRRARLGAEGRIEGDWGYRFEVDLANSNVTIADAYVQYLGWGGTTVTIGQHKSPTSLERLTGSPALLFLERATVVETLTNNGVGGDRNVGVSAGWRGSNWTLTAGAFGEPLNRTRGNAGTGSEGWGVYGRGTFVPVNSNGNLVHVGASAFWRDTGSTTGLRFGDRPEVRVDNRRIVDTQGGLNPALLADSITFVGVEGIAAFGPFFVLGEYGRSELDRLPNAGIPAPDVSFDGFYLAGGWFLTGERLPYSNGVLGSVRPNNPLGSGGSGAWAVTARYSTVDLDDADILGGETKNYTLGLNWYPVSNVRTTFNFVRFDSDRQGVSQNGNVFAGRIGLDW